LNQTTAQRVLEVENLSVTFSFDGKPLQAVNALSLHVDRGETLAIVGESGSGKSVTALAIMRLVELGGGRIASARMVLHREDGTTVDLAHAPEPHMRALRGNDLGMIFQEPMTSLNPVFTIGWQLVEAIRLHRACDAKTAQADARRMLDRVRIPDAAAMMGRYPHELSGGMRQRVMIAMALSCQPALLIADEPTTALDVTIQAQILQLLRELQRDLNMAMLFITHDMGVVAAVADRVIVMRKGDVVEHGSVHDIFNAPQHAYTRALMAAVPRLGAMQSTSIPALFALPLAIDATPTAPLPTRPAGDAVILSVRDLVTRFDVRSGIFSRVKQRVHAVEQVSFDLHAGETLALVGESGCGKTSTGRSLLRLTKPTAGDILFEGQPVRWQDATSLASLRRHVQFVFQDPFASLNPRMRVGECVKEPMLIHRLASDAQAERHVADLFEQVGLDASMMRRWPHELSGGQRQRICIARALSVNPKVIVADEPVSALDVSVQAQIVNLLIDLQRDLGVSYLFISHDMAVVERISHRVAVMYLGQIVEIGPRQAIFENPQHAYTKKLMQAVLIADPNRASRRHTTLESGDLPSPVRDIGYQPVVQPLVQVGDGHFVARHRIGGAF